MPNFPDAKTAIIVKKSRYDETCDKFPDVFMEPAMLSNKQIKHEI